MSDIPSIPVVDPNKPKGYYSPTPGTDIVTDPTQSIQFNLGRNWVPEKVTLNKSRYGNIDKGLIEKLKETLESKGFEKQVFTVSPLSPLSPSAIAQKERAWDRARLISDIYRPAKDILSPDVTIVISHEGAISCAGPFGDAAFEVFIAPLIDKKITKTEVIDEPVVDEEDPTVGM